MVEDGLLAPRRRSVDRDSGITFYVDGAPAGSGAGAAMGSVSNSAPLQLAKVSGYRNFSGDLDEAALYEGLSRHGSPPTTRRVAENADQASTARTADIVGGPLGAVPPTYRSYQSEKLSSDQILRLLSCVPATWSSIRRATTSGWKNPWRSTVLRGERLA